MIEQTLWWRHENLHREILRDYATRIKVLQPKQAKLEADFIMNLPNPAISPLEERAAFTRSCFEDVDRMEAKTLAAIKDLPKEHIRPVLDRIAWSNFDKAAKRP